MDVGGAGLAASCSMGGLDSSAAEDIVWDGTAAADDVHTVWDGTAAADDVDTDLDGTTADWGASGGVKGSRRNSSIRSNVPGCVRFFFRLA